MKHIITLITCIISSLSCSFVESGELAPKNTHPPSNTRDGWMLSPQDKGGSRNPIKINGGSSMEEVSSLILDYIQRNHPDFKPSDDIIIRNNSVRMVFMYNEEGKELCLFFDVSDYIKRQNKLHKKQTDKSIKKMLRAMKKYDLEKNRN